MAGYVFLIRYCEGTIVVDCWYESLREMVLILHYLLYHVKGH